MNNRTDRTGRTKRAFPRRKRKLRTALCAVPVGTLYVKETENSEGYMLCDGGYSCAEGEDGVHEVTVTADSTEDSPAEVRCTVTPAHDASGFTIRKEDAESGASEAQGGADLSGAQFTIRYYAGYYDGEDIPEEPDREWVIETKRNANRGTYEASLMNAYKVSGDEWFTYGGNTALPLGTYTMQETLAPEGYLLEGAPTTSANWVSEHTYEAPVHVAQVTADGNAVQELSFAAADEEGAEDDAEEDTDAADAESAADADEAADGDADADEAGDADDAHVVSDSVKRFDFVIETQDGGTHDAGGSVEYKITSLTTGETHYFWTDASGEYVSSADVNPHTYDTDAATDRHSGLWFYGSADAGLQEAEEVTDLVGALPYDTYQIDEIEGENNAGQEMYHAVFGFTDDDYAGYVLTLAVSDGYADTGDEGTVDAADDEAIVAEEVTDADGADDEAAGADDEDADDADADGAAVSSSDGDGPGSSGSALQDAAESAGAEDEGASAWRTSSVRTGVRIAGTVAGIAVLIAAAAAIVVARRRRRAG